MKLKPQIISVLFYSLRFKMGKQKQKPKQ